MTRKDSRERPRLLLLVIFVAVIGLLLAHSIRRWEEMDAGETWARAAELLLIAVGGWVVVWPESFPPWRSPRGSRGPRRGPDESLADPDAAAEPPRDSGSEDS